MKATLAVVLCISSAAMALAADRPQGIGAAEAVARTALGADCDMNGMPEVPMAGPDDEGFGHSVHTFSYRASYQSDEEPETEVTLYQLFCGSGAYNVRHAFVTKFDSEESPKLVTFPLPDVEYAYTDDERTKLKADPTVHGFRATGVLVNATYDAQRRTIKSHTAWRGMGDAWDSGTWGFREGAFILTRFEVDPTYGPPDPTVPESYVVYDSGRQIVPPGLSPGR